MVYSAGMGHVSFALILNVLALKITLENLNKAMKDLAAPLREELVHEQGWSGRQRIRNILYDIENIRPLTEHSIDASILTAMLSFIVSHVGTLIKMLDQNNKKCN